MASFNATLNEPIYIAIEEFLTRGLEKDGILVGFDSGRMNEVGAAHVFVNAVAWQSDMIKLAHNARAIFVIPSDSAGILWELRTLSDNAMHSKTIIIMPPRQSAFAGVGCDVEVLWAKARDVCSRDLRLALPAFVPSGMLIRFSLEGVPATCLPFPKSEAGLRRAVDRLVRAAC